MEETQPASKISVVIVSWNSADALRRCLGALERSAGRENIEIIVVDNGSRDESPTLDSEFPNVNLLRLPRNFGVVKAFNIGMRTATGDYFLLLKPEVEVLPDTVAGLVTRLEQTAGASAVAPMIVDPDGNPALKLRSLPDPLELYRAWRAGGFQDWQTPTFPEEAMPVGYLSVAALLIRANFLKGMRYIDERLANSWWDLEICHQVRRAARKILVLRDVRAVLHPEFDPRGLPPGGRALLSADLALGAAVFAGKHYGWWAGLQLRLRAICFALFSVFRGKDVAFHFARLGNLLSGQRFDGSQTVL